MTFLSWLAKWCKIHNVYIYSHSVLLLLLTNIFIHIQQLSFYSRNIFIHEYIHSHLRDVFIHIQRFMYSFTFTIEILVQHGVIFIQHFVRTPFAHHWVPAPANF